MGKGKIVEEYSPLDHIPERLLPPQLGLNPSTIQPFTFAEGGAVAADDLWVFDTMRWRLLHHTL
jgi:hypothetical protein